VPAIKALRERRMRERSEGWRKVSKKMNNKIEPGIYTHSHCCFSLWLRLNIFRAD
jgi:hypothetical protein